MRKYARILPTFWTKGSGKKLRGNAPAIAMAMYLFTAPVSNMIGLYYLPLPTMAHELGMSIEDARAALAAVQEAEIAMYDEDAELVFIPNGALYQIGEQLKPGDKQAKGIAAELSHFEEHRFAAMFWQQYARAFNLPSEAQPRSFEGPSEDLASPTEGIATDESEPGAPLPKGKPKPKRTPEAPSKPGAGAGAGAGADSFPGAGAGVTAAAPLSAEWFLDELRRHPPLETVATPEFAAALAGRSLANERPPAWLAQAIADAADDAAGQGLLPEPLQRKVRGYCDNARKPKERPVEAPPQPARGLRLLGES